MKLKKGQSIHVGGKKYKGGDEISDELAKKHGLVKTKPAATPAKVETKKEK